MTTDEKLKILADASQYDLSCACGTSDQDRRHRGKNGAWLYPVSLPRGGYGVILKTLLSNACINDCQYCPFRAEREARRYTLEPNETADYFLSIARRLGLMGIFLSSGVAKEPDHTMDRMLEVARLLRRRHQYHGYIHLKVLPGASDAAIEEAVGMASTVSVNIEVPGEKHFIKLSAKKNFMEDIIRPLKLISRLTARGSKRERVKQTTQFIVGASDETDAEIVKYTYGLYERLHLERVYFSSYQRELGSSDLPGKIRGNDLLMREHRLYQVDFLLRKYGFKEGEIPFDQAGHLSLERDPKQVWADRHPECFPVSINTAPRSTLLRVPGLGPVTVRRILDRRRQGRLRELSEVGLKGICLALAARYVTRG